MRRLNKTLSVMLMCLFATIAGLSVYAATNYIEVYARDNAPSPITGSFPYATIDVWRYTYGTYFGSGSETGGDPTLNPPYYPGPGTFIRYAWDATFTDVEYKVPIYKLVGNSWVFICYLRPRVWFRPDGNYDGSYAYSGFVKRLH